MNLKDLRKLKGVIIDLQDFVTGNCDADESGIYEKLTEQSYIAKEIIEAEQHKIYLKNSIAKNKRKRK
jgi:hypothetical protein